MRNRIREAVQWMYDETYLQDGVEIGDIIEKKEKSESDWRSRLFGFFGLPNRRNGGWKQSFSNLAKNFIGYQDNVVGAKKIINLITMPFTVLINIAIIPFRLAINIAKIFTEFLPGLLDKLVASAYEYLDSLLKKTKKLPRREYPEIEAVKPEKLPYGQRVVIGIGLGLLTITRAVTSQIHFVGRSITSPINAIKANWYSITKWMQEKTNSKMLARLVAGLVVACGMALTITAYSILFPLAIKTLLPSVLKFISSHLPVAIDKTIATMAKVMDPVLTKIGHALKPVFDYIEKFSTFFNIADITATLSPAWMGLTALVTTALTTVGVAIDHAIDKFQAWWHKPDLTPAIPVRRALNEDRKEKSSTRTCITFLRTFSDKVFGSDYKVGTLKKKSSTLIMQPLPDGSVDLPDTSVSNGRISSDSNKSVEIQDTSSDDVSLEDTVASELLYDYEKIEIPIANELPMSNFLKDSLDKVRFFALPSVSPQEKDKPSLDLRRTIKK